MGDGDSSDCLEGDGDVVTPAPRNTFSYHGNRCQDLSLPMPTQTGNPYPLGVLGKVIELSIGDYLLRYILRTRHPEKTVLEWTVPQ